MITQLPQLVDRQIVLLGCTTNGGTLAKFDADGEYLDEEIEGTLRISRCLRNLDY